ncbi:MAG: formimidoylglutamase [Bdellovibrionales bacterium]|nr:formimidoylglutamase [Bdellovibrionales bacterium]
MSFKPCPENVIYRRNDPNDLRIGDLLFNKKPHDCEFILAGYPDDEGIKLNGGRPGAAEGPNAIRNRLSRMTVDRPANEFPIYYDIGNLNIEEGNLEERHKEVLQVGYSFLKQNKKWIGLGGGHDFGYPDGAAFLKAYSEKKPVVINFDAHLDVRPLDKGLTSGTPFYRLLSEFPNFDFYEIGIQDECNSINHKKWCFEMGAKVLNYSQIYNSSSTPLNNICNFLEELKHSKRPTFISLDIDVFSASYAMGCSQSWPMGLTANDFQLVFSFLLENLDIRSLGIYEVSPPLDSDDRTSKLAAQIIYRYLQYG